METNQKKQWANPEILDLDVLMTNSNANAPGEDQSSGTSH